MSAPNLTIQVEPVEAAALVWATLAAKSSGDQPDGQLLLVLKITNNEPAPIEVTEVTISLPNIPPYVMKLPPVTTPATPPLKIDPGPANMREWTLLDSWNPNIMLPTPAPATITVGLSCVGLGSPAKVFTAPAEVTMPLAPYSSPAPGGGYAFPFKAADLNKGEFLTGLSSGDYHRARAYDLSIHKYFTTTSQWLPFPAGANIIQNQSFYVWGKPVYAIADGVVAQVHNSMPDNTPGVLPTSPAFNEGNHVYIRHGAEIVMYAHFKSGTIDPAIVAGASVVKGQLLGRVGNSGRSYGPHLHISVCRSLTTPPPEEPLRPLPFSDIYVLALTAVIPASWPPNDNSPWNHVTAQCLPRELSAIWPGNLKLGKKPLKRFSILSWYWLIVLGTVMFFPIGDECLACGTEVSPVLGLISLAIGVVGLVLSRRAISGEAVPQAVALSQRLGKEHELD